MRVLLWLGAAEAPLAELDRAALALARSVEGATLVVAAIAPALPAGLVEAVRGAGRILQVDAPSLLDAGPFAAGAALARLVKRLDVDLVIAGDAADPEGLGLAPAVAARELDAPYLARVEALAPAAEGLVATARAAGRRRGLLLRLPAVVCASPLAHTTAEAPPGEGVAPAVERIGPADLGLSAAAPRAADWLGALAPREGKPRSVERAGALVALPAGVQRRS